MIIALKEMQIHKRKHNIDLEQGCQTHFPQGPHQPRSCLQGAKIILGLFKCNYSSTVKELKLHSAL